MLRRERLKRGARASGWVAGVLLAVLLLPSVVGLVRAAVTCQMWATPTQDDSGGPSSPVIKQVTDGISDYARAEDGSYLTLPEWYVVFSTDEYAAFIAKNPPSQFPYFKAIGQYWDSWDGACEAIRGRYPFNGGYQFALIIIGINFTAENTLRGAYEWTVGHLTEAISTPELTEEDAYARGVAKEYGDFIHMTPWFDFPFTEKLQGLWATTGLWGRNPIRKWERKLFLSTDYGVKAFYGWLIHLGADAVYGGPDDTQIEAVVEGLTPEMLEEQNAPLDTLPKVRLVQKINDTQALIKLTRWEVLTRTVPGLTQEGLQFVEIAGNDEILVTAIGPTGQPEVYEHATYLFEMPVLIQPGMSRVMLKVKVAELHLLIQELGEKDIQLEHIYDY